MARNGLLRLSWMVCGVVIMVCCQTLVCASPAPAGALDVSINFNPGKGNHEDALWLGYLMARAAYIEKHRASYPQTTGIITPTFAEEVAARSSAATIYRELQQKDHDLKVAYFNDLSRVQSSSFMREYVWTYLHQPSWGAAPDDLRLTNFDEWRKANLADHQAITKGSISFGTNAKTDTAKSEAPNREYTLLVKGREVLSKGDPQRAIVEYFDPVIRHYEMLYKDTPKRVFSAQSQMQAFVYIALPDEKKRATEVLDGTWSDAYLMKAYALTELKKVNDAQTALESAIALSPLNAQYISELAYTYQAQKDCAKSIDTYVRASEAAEMGSDDATKTIDLTRAWRGQGYCLVEQGKLDEAEVMYRKCLALDPKDDKARGELGYIEGLRKK
jgi:Tetratricopeptide repeat